MTAVDTDPEALLSRFGLSAFRPGQRDIVDAIGRGEDVMCVMPTGGGKSLCYQLPTLARDGMTIVVSPLIALMKDQVDALVRKGISATFINSSLDRQQREYRYAGIAEGKWDLLYVTPERFQKPEFLKVLSQRTVELLAIDEAHCISQWGHDFRPDYTRVGDIRKSLGSPTTIALTATATIEVQDDIARQLGLELIRGTDLNDATPDSMLLFHQGIDRPNLSLTVEEVWDDDMKYEQIVNMRSEVSGPGIVYFTLIRKLAEFSDRLLADGTFWFWLPTPLAWASTKRTSATFFTRTCQVRWKATTRKSAGQGVMENHQSVCCSTTSAIWRLKWSSSAGAIQTPSSIAACLIFWTTTWKNVTRLDSSGFARNFIIVRNTIAVWKQRSRC